MTGTPRKLSTASWLAIGFALVATSFAGSAEAQAKWTLTETLRIGGEETGPTLFAWPKSVEADAKGRIFVYEHSTQDIRMFGADGKHIRTIGRPGSGPGELRNAEGLVITRDGKIWVRDAANSRFSIFSGEGVYETSWRARFCTSQGSWAPKLDRAGRIIDEDCIIKENRAAGYAVLAYHTDMSRVDTIADKPECGSKELSEAATWISKTARGTSYRQIPWAPRGTAIVTQDADYWCALNSSRYELVRLKPGAKDTARITRAVPSVPVTSIERDSVIASTEAKGGVEFDIYGTDGRIVATAALGVVNNPSWLPFVVRGDNIYTIVVDQDDIPHLARFKIGR